MKKGQQLKHIEERFLENCRTYYVHDKPVTSLIITVVFGRQDAGRDKIACFMTGKLMRLLWPQSVPCQQARTPSQNAHTPGRGSQFVDLVPERLPGVALAPDDERGQTGTGSRIRSASLASNGGAAHYWRAASADARR